jgi:hypothetical protein
VKREGEEKEGETKKGRKREKHRMDSDMTISSRIVVLTADSLAPENQSSNFQ